jgi:hypothetical protein
MASEEQLVRLDELMERTAAAIADYLVSAVTADVRREWNGALTAAVDFAALAIDTEPSDDEVEEVRKHTAEAVFVAALLMLLFLNVRDAQAQAIALGLAAPGSVAPAAITTRLRTLRQIISARVVAAFGKAISSGADRQEALTKAMREAENSARIFAEAEALAAVNGGINGLGDYLETRGLTITKTWYTRRDNRVRETHSRAEGQEVPHRSYFNVGGWPMQYPGDRNAPPNLWVNCRCIMVLGSPSPLTDVGA